MMNIANLLSPARKKRTAHSRRRSTSDPQSVSSSVLSQSVSRASWKSCRSSAIFDPPDPGQTFTPPPTPKVAAVPLQASGSSPFILKDGVKHHSYPRTVAPYPLAYDRRLLDHDSYDHASLIKSTGSASLHEPFKQIPPRRVLDLGCGTGEWVIAAAAEWKDCQFVGLDLVPLFPDLNLVGKGELNVRIQWTTSNFLEPLPFSDQEFDYIHAKGIAVAVPEDKWHVLMDEIVRIMKPGGTFEIIEDDLQFPCPLSHPIIQETYYSLLSSLFINAWPLSLLPNLLNTHLRKVRTLQFDQEGNPKRKCEDDKLEDKGEEERRRMYVARTYAAVLAMKSAMRDRCCGGTAGVSIESFDKAWRRFEKDVSRRAGYRQMLQKNLDWTSGDDSGTARRERRGFEEVVYRATTAFLATK